MISLTALLTVFGHFGVEVLEERPQSPSETTGDHLYEFRLRHPSWTDAAEQRRDLEDALAAESDGFNAFVLGAGLTWRQVVVLRLLAKYLRQGRVEVLTGLCRVDVGGPPRDRGSEVSAMSGEMQCATSRTWSTAINVVDRTA